MERVDTSVEKQEPASYALPFARSYQIEALERAIKQNTIAFLETGSGKTLIAIMLLRSYAHFLRNPSPYKAVFLVPTVVLVSQQAEVVEMHSDLKVGMYWGEMGVDYWDAAIWKQELDKHEVLVMTPMILLNALRHSFISLKLIKLLIMDECHNAKKNHPYARIMKEFYHPLSHKSEVPRIFGMTASPVKAKGSNAETVYWKHIQALENLMNSKVYTCDNQSVLAKYIPFATAKFKFYEQIDSPFSAHVKYELYNLVAKHVSSVKEKSVKESAEKSTRRKLKMLASAFYFCVNELGLWLTMKAAESFSSVETGVFCEWFSDAFSKSVAEGFNLDAKNLFSSYFPSGWSIYDIEPNAEAGFFSKKVFSLFESLLEYRDVKDLRCIVFVERVVTAIAVESFLNELLPKYCGWETKYIAGNHHVLQSQSRKQQNKIVDEFREGKVNIIVATSILEEGLDVQSCNLVIRFDPSFNVCSFIQSRGRARMKNSDFLLMVKSGDASALKQAETYLASIDIMRHESLRHSSLPCEPVELNVFDDIFYLIESTGALVNLNSSISLIYFYCSRLPSDGYFKPLPRCTIDEDSKTCTLQLPNSCPLQSVSVNGDGKMLKQIACLEACKKLHQMGALTDNLVPDIEVEEAIVKDLENEIYNEEHAIYFPPELFNDGHIGHSVSYHCYLIELKMNLDYNVPLHNVILIVNAKLDLDAESTSWNLEVIQGSMGVELKYLGKIGLTREHVHVCRMFQVAVFRALIDQNFDKVKKALDEIKMSKDGAYFDYLILPSTSTSCKSSTIDWRIVESVLFQKQDVSKCHNNCSRSNGSAQIHTKNGLMCSCMLESCLVYTPHNGHMYCTSGFINHLNSNSYMSLNESADKKSYKHYFKIKHGIDLCFENEALLNARAIFRAQNFLSTCRKRKQKDPERMYCELPPELCYVIISPISVATLYTFSLVPSIMHRIESLLMAAKLQRIYRDHSTQNVIIPTIKILEAITTKKCQEAFHLESLEALGDSFLKYAVGQQVFKTHQDHHEGLLSLKRERTISNSGLCKLGCKHKIPGFIHDQIFEVKNWRVPGDPSGNPLLEEEWVAPCLKMYRRGTQKLKAKRVADAVEALIGAYLSSGGEVAALSFMNWLGIEVDFTYVPYNRKFPDDPRMHVNVKHLESLLKYSFHDPSLLVEALTHGSYMKPEIPRCYQRLEFLGDSVLDHLITLHLYSNYTGLSPGMLTDMRSASVNNECYAYSSFRVELYKHILHASHDLHKDLVAAIHSFEQLHPESTFGWEIDIHFPKVLADVIESLAGAIFVDSGYNKDVVFKSLKPLLEPLVTPETLKIHPVKELDLLCQKHHFPKRKHVFRQENAAASYKLVVEANGVEHSYICTQNNKKLAEKIASRAILKCLKDSIPGL